MGINVFEFKNVIITLKAFLIGIIIAIAGLVVRLIMLFTLPLGILLMILWFVFTLFLWGYLARIWWKWK